MSKTIKDKIDKELPLKKGNLQRALLALVDTLESIPHYNKRQFQEERRDIQDALHHLGEHWNVTELLIDSITDKIKGLIEEDD